MVVTKVAWRICGYRRQENYSDHSGRRVAGIVSRWAGWADASASMGWELIQDVDGSTGIEGLAAGDTVVVCGDMDNFSCYIHSSNYQPRFQPPGKKL